MNLNNLEHPAYRKSVWRTVKELTLLVVGMSFIMLAIPLTAGICYIAFEEIKEAIMPVLRDIF